MLKKLYVITALVVGLNAAYGMEKEHAKHEYIEDARQLFQEKNLYFSVLPKDILGIVQYYRLADLIELNVAEARDYKQILQYLKLLAAGEYTQLFNNPQFIDGIIQKISSKFGKDPKEIAQQINTLGVQLWLTHLRPNQLKLLDAARDGGVATVYQLVAAGVNANTRSNCRDTALMHAALKGHTEVVKILIQAGSAVNAQGYYGNTALSLAAEWWHAAVVRMLIHARADVNIKNEYGATALIEVARHDIDAKIYLIINKAALDSAHRAHTEIVHMLLAAGAHVATRDNSGRSALEYAHIYKKKEIIRLLEQVALVDIRPY